MIQLARRQRVRVAISVAAAVAGLCLASVNSARAASWFDGGCCLLFTNSTQIKVGIGTSMIGQPYILQVAGNTYVTGYLRADGGLKIKANWSIEVPDYVFDPGRYHLMTLGELETFVRANRHLPDMPSAAELKDDGMDVAEMNLRLLKKVEELTLYVIEQDKKIRELSAKVESAPRRNRAR